MACDNCDPATKVGHLYKPAELENALGPVPPDAGEARCRDCGARWVLRRALPELWFADRAVDLPLRFEGTWVERHNAGRPGEGDTGGWRLRLGRDGDRLRGTCESFSYNEYARDESMRSSSSAVEGRVEGDVATLQLGEPIWLENEPSRTMVVKPVALIGHFGRPCLRLMAAPDAAAARRHQTNLVFEEEP